MATVEALTNINHDGVDYAPGSTFECSDVQAEALIDTGAAKKTAQPAAPAPAAKDEKPADTKPAETKDAKDTGAAKKTSESSKTGSQSK